MEIYELFHKNDEKVFYEICSLLEQKYPYYKKHKELVDVDGSVVQLYFNGDNRIVVINAFDWESIIARTNVDLSEFVSELNNVIQN